MFNCNFKKIFSSYASFVFLQEDFNLWCSKQCSCRFHGQEACMQNREDILLLTEVSLSYHRCLGDQIATEISLVLVAFS